jgi:hypothetical protein
VHANKDIAQGVSVREGYTNQHQISKTLPFSWRHVIDCRSLRSLQSGALAPKWSLQSGELAPKWCAPKWCARSKVLNGIASKFAIRYARVDSAVHSAGRKRWRPGFVLFCFVLFCFVVVGLVQVISHSQLASQLYFRNFQLDANEFKMWPSDSTQECQKGEIELHLETNQEPSEKQNKNPSETKHKQEPI